MRGSTTRRQPLYLNGKADKRAYWRGTLQAGAEYALSPYSDMTVDNGATLDMNGFDNEVNTLSGSGTVENSASGTTVWLGVGVDDTPNETDHDTTFSGLLVDGTGQLALAKLGDDMLTLTGVNTYSGQTIVEDGSLNVTGSIADSPVTLAGGQVIDGPSPTSVATTVTLISDADPNNPPVYGDSVTFTATVSPTNSGYGTPTGTVDFYDEASGAESDPITLDTNGCATWTPSSPLGAGDHYIVATYTSDSGTFVGGTVGEFDQTVNPADTTTTVTASPSSTNYGDSLTITADVGASSPGNGTPTGSVEFWAGTTDLGGATLDAGTATWSGYADMACGIGVGASTITAVYGGDANFTGSQSTASLTVTSQNSTEQGTFCLFVGDDSGSASELWSITVGNNTYTAPGYGETGSADFTYAVGNCYDITLQHLGTDPAFLASPPSWGYPSGISGPNYDWDASVTEVGSSVPYWIDDPNSTAPVVGPWGGDQYHLLQQHIWDVIGDPDLTAGKTAYLYVPNINIDTDSNNDGTIDHATDDAVEDQSPGCYVAVHQSGASDLAEADISPLFASAPPASEDMAATLSATSGISVYADAAGTQLLFGPGGSQTWTTMGDIPSKVYVAGVNSGSATLTWTLCAQGNTIGSDSVNYTVRQLQLYLTDAENPNGINVTANGVTPAGVEVGETVTLTAKINGNPVEVGWMSPDAGDAIGSYDPYGSSSELVPLTLSGEPQSSITFEWVASGVLYMSATYGGGTPVATAYFVVRAPDVTVTATPTPPAAVQTNPGTLVGGTVTVVKAITVGSYPAYVSYVDMEYLAWNGSTPDGWQVPASPRPQATSLRLPSCLGAQRRGFKAPESTSPLVSRRGWTADSQHTVKRTPPGSRPWSMPKVPRPGTSRAYFSATPLAA